MPHLKEEVRIACALINAFGKRVTDHPLVNEIINDIYLKHDAPNYLCEFVIQNNLNQRRAAFQAINSSEGFQQFPILSYEDLLIMSLGPYQVTQARSYYGEHLKENGTFFIEVYEDFEVDYNLNQYNIVVCDPWLTRAKILSRHQSNRIYFVYILLNNSLKNRNKLVGHYCSCIVGKRTLGCCAHVMCIVWYMGWARHQEIQPPAAFLDQVIISDEEED
uniref:SWIM-type domain-containing protein n=1 Tax=Pectinophora gossypiella TaxID=13191 RepID=A0A1E1WJE0_PECGO